MNRILEAAKRLNALAQAGLTYSTNAYDLERFEEIRAISVEMLNELTDEPIEKIAPLFAAGEGEYPTPKVDIRAVVFRGDDELLMVQEKIDGLKWTLPGGWADVGYTPSEVAVKETEEETGLHVKPGRLLAVFDKRVHPHPPQPWYVYKFFIRCEVTGGEIRTGIHDIGEVRWVKREELSHIPLSTDRVTASQLEMLFTFVTNPEAPALCD
ncbi:NUDIX hydrolase [Siphonobacter aquaeclarae]|uniref:ADP-ribose pyrophosphatase YjhB, NUDIX family n=1 Tax=Siphonobacter aquaeclarae TaxID=563176 RepID=A0A1G9MYA5_9BACT|nr:NUDIX hydrolase [Siphonobacter aquaeclarae]MBO9638795.1 NUDIX hydrolase [Siphonobacter aquaeclarae]SDL79209.1 ADP-ribose pyrophosphatase YjhB, NUDIX family [Siphonobacter aquaeclarae]